MPCVNYILIKLGKKEFCLFDIFSKTGIPLSVSFSFFLHSNSYVGVSLVGYLFLCLFDICITSLIVSVPIFCPFCNTLFLVLRVPVERYSLNIKHVISIM